jgi:hypothetical protein
MGATRAWKEEDFAMESPVEYITPLGIAFILLGIAVVIGLVVSLSRSRHSAVMRARYGSEYDEAVRQAGGRYRAENMLHEREKRVAAFNIVSLSESRRQQFIYGWRDIQALFVDDPAGSVARADVLLGEVMQERGYPVADFDRRSEDLSVDHPEVVQNYRAGHDIAVRCTRGECGTEDLRQAILHYRALFDDLVNEPTPGSPTRPLPGMKVSG